MADRQHLLGLAIAALGLVALLTVLAIRVTFRLAGPVHAVSGMMHAMASGDFRSLRRLRRRDEFRQLEEGVFAVHAAWSRMAAEDAALLERVAGALRARTAATGEGDPESETLADEAATLARRRRGEFGET
jgi:methyl-accepting chemotaxis protein